MVLEPVIASFVAWAGYVIANYGYAGAFVVSLISSASIFLPVPGFLFVLAAGALLNPVALGVVAGAGSAIGELTGYLIGKGGGGAMKKKDVKWVKKGEKWFREGRGFLFILIFAATPLPDDVTGILGGMFNYDWKRLLLASFIGKVAFNIVLALAGSFGLNSILGALGAGL